MSKLTIFNMILLCICMILLAIIALQNGQIAMSISILLTLIGWVFLSLNIYLDKKQHGK